ncbi:sulfotransferase [Thalassotalea nanhaiensis]|uniref:Sulfotransferase n=1 Tax=Thalassotalea nanhaiensis TaxID=3065648 RepID=A0ABY9TJN2_9GAMM|nr:sulfotransferase [Colwelliaceae bacterium SQ345]
MLKVCFVLGVMPRCGTNFLQNMLRLHTSCYAPGPVWEDFVISQLDILFRYSQRVSNNWDPYWFRNAETNHKDLLMQCLGQGIQDFLKLQVKNSNPKNEIEYIISKTPSLKGIDKYSLFFKNCKFIMIMRDGRSVVASGEKSFSWDFELAAIQWKLNAKKIKKFKKMNDINFDTFLLIKFENLIVEPENQFKKMIEYLGLSLNDFDFSKLKSLPVSGSSDLKSSSKAMHWKPVSKENKFDPLNRFSNWSLNRKKIFHYIAKNEMEYFGYHSDIALSYWDRVWISLYLLIWPIKFVLKKLKEFFHSIFNKAI